MDFEELIVLLPCQSLEDLSLDRDAFEAEQLLSAWSVLYHPALIFNSRTMPTWRRAGNPPEDPAGRLFILPRSSANRLPDDWLEQAQAAGALVVRGCKHRDQMAAVALQALGDRAVDFDPELVEDFFALGFCHFQVELLTRQLRYMSNLDEAQFQRVTLAAAESAAGGDQDAARENLRSAFDLLTEAREYFYPVEAYLLDLTLVASTTLGESLRTQLAGAGPTSLLMSAELVDEMARRRPATLVALREAVERDAATIIGGEFHEHEPPMLPMEAILGELKRGLECYDRHLGRRPTAFGRQRFGLSPALPQILKKAGFVGAYHCTLDDGRFPKGNQSKIRWQGVDGTQVEALTRVPSDVTRPEYFLKLPEKLGDTLDLDHVATAVFAHWPGQTSPWYDALKRMDAYSPVLGRFVSISEYFEKTEHGGRLVRYSADQYRSPFLRQAVTRREPDPISRWVRYYRRRAAGDALQTLTTMTDLAAGTGSETAEVHNLLGRVDLSCRVDSGVHAELDADLKRQLDEAMSRFARVLPRDNAATEKGFLLTNPWSFSRRVCVDTSEWTAPGAPEQDTSATVEPPGPKHAMIELPTMGFAWVMAGSGCKSSPRSGDTGDGRRKKRAKKVEVPPMAEENQLRNEYFEVTFDPVTGAIQAIRDYVSRGNRLAQQIALRMSPSGATATDDDPEQAYSLMAADRFEITSSGPLVGEMVCRGRLMCRDGTRAANFVQTTRSRRGSPILEIEVDLDVRKKPGPNPWDSYYALRFAWGDATADIYREVNQASRPTERELLESPCFVDVRSVGDKRITLLTGGLPYHRRFGLRKMDTLLVVQGETARSFRVGIGVNLLYPVPAALGFLAPELMLAEEATPPPNHRGWLFHVDAKNVVATCWEPLLSETRPVGFRVRLLETEGRNSSFGLRSFRPIESARKTNFLGQQPTDLPVEGDRVRIDVGPHEWTQVEVTFAG